MKIEGTSKIKYNIQQSEFYIDEVRIHNIEDIFPPDFYILHNKNDQIVFFESLVYGEKMRVEKCIFIYKMGYGVKKYSLELAEYLSNNYIIFQRKKYCIKKSGEMHKFNRIYFHENTFIYEQIKRSEKSSYKIQNISPAIRKYEQNIHNLLGSMIFYNLYGLYEFILTDENINKLYILFFNGKEHITCIIARTYYHTLYNFFLFENSDNFDRLFLCKNTEKIILKNYEFKLKLFKRTDVKIYNKLLLEVINNILLEHQVILYSSSPNRIFNIIIFIINSIAPFNFNYYVNSNLDRRNIDLLEMPFPFLIGISFIPSKMKNNIVFLNLDEGNIKNIFRTILPFKNRLLRYLREDDKDYLFSKYFEVLRNNIDIRRENELKNALQEKNIENLKSIILNPKSIFNRSMKIKFFSYFGNTQIFHEYLNYFPSCEEQHIFLLCENIYTSVLRTNLIIDKYVYKIILLLFPPAADDIFFTVKDNRDLLEDILENIIYGISMEKNYSILFKIYDFILHNNIPFKPKYFKAIVYSNRKTNIYKLREDIDNIKIENGYIIQRNEKYRLLNPSYIFCKILNHVKNEEPIESNELSLNIISYISFIKIDYFSSISFPKIIIA